MENIVAIMYHTETVDIEVDIHRHFTAGAHLDIDIITGAKEKVLKRMIVYFQIHYKAN